MFRIPENVDNKYRFVMIAALRAEQLQCGAVPRVDSESLKTTIIALQEVAEGLVDAWDGTQPEPVEALANAEE